MTNRKKRFILFSIKKALTEKKLFFQRPKRGTPRLKASCLRRSLYHSRAACEEQDGRFPLKEPKATAAKP